MLFPAWQGAELWISITLSRSIRVMAFALINIQKIKTISELTARWKHNRRISKSWNVNHSKSDKNEHQGEDIPTKILNRIKEINSIRKNEGGRKLRNDTVPAVELVLSASHSFFKGKDDNFINEWAQTQIDWAADYYKGRGRIAGWDLHSRDEKTPHLHIIFIPEVTQFNKHAGKDLPTLSAWKFEGKKSEMNRARSSHAKANKIYGLKRGANYYKEGRTPPDYRSMDELRRLTKQAVDDLELVESLYDVDMLEILDQEQSNQLKKIKDRVKAPEQTPNA